MDHSELARAYAEAMGRPASKIERLPGGAGNRTYWRASDGTGQSAIVMELPPEPAKSEEVSKDAAAHDLPFLNVHRYLARLGVRVPRIYLDAHRRGFVVLEDLTDRTLEMALRDGVPGAAASWPEHRREIYARAIDQLARLRAHAERDPDPSCLAFGRAFDFDLYQWEFEHFIEYGLVGRGAKPTEAELRELRKTFTRISRQLAAAPRGFTHRDYQSRNIMVLPSGEQVVIDFQDALQGPRQYDLVALLRDSYVELPRDLIDEMLRRYLQKLPVEGGPKLDEREFVGFFDLLTVQRKLKDAGRFVFIDQVKKNPSFLAHIPSSLRYVKDALARRPELGKVRDILARHVPELK
ncbi:MAG TPA: phosphotransferase [Myxococcales bacterium]|jgi:N-acetylmuramate 1-kinase|nr:phosphotransferase [Myxococcales bacterium]